MFLHQNAGQNHNKTMAEKYFDVARVQISWKDGIDHNFIHEETKSRLNADGA
jgi:hypothetical protein